MEEEEEEEREQQPLSHGYPTEPTRPGILQSQSSGLSITV